MTKSGRKPFRPEKRKRDASQWIWCDNHQKYAYFTRKDARRAARIYKVGHLREYECFDAALTLTWHVGHLPQAVLYGMKTEDEIFPPANRKKRDKT